MAGYVAQLLPDRLQAEVLRDALDDWLHSRTNTEPAARIDAGWALLAKLTQDMRKREIL